MSNAIIFASSVYVWGKNCHRSHMKTASSISEADRWTDKLILWVHSDSLKEKFLRKKTKYNIKYQKAVSDRRVCSTLVLNVI